MCVWHASYSKWKKPPTRRSRSGCCRQIDSHPVDLARLRIDDREFCRAMFKVRTNRGNTAKRSGDKASKGIEARIIGKGQPHSAIDHADICAGVGLPGFVVDAIEQR